MPLTKKTTAKAAPPAGLVRALDGHICRVPGTEHDVVVREGDTRRADDPVVACAPSLWIDDASTDGERAAARAAIYDRALDGAYNQATNTHVVNAVGGIA